MSHYFGKIKEYGNKLDISSYGKNGFDWNYERNAGRKVTRNLHEMSFEEIFSKAVNVYRSFPKKLKKFEETILCNQDKFPDYGYFHIGKKNEKCRTKMLTVTFEKDIQDRGEAYKEFDRVLKSVEKKNL